MSKSESRSPNKACIRVHTYLCVKYALEYFGGTLRNDTGRLISGWFTFCRSCILAALWDEWRNAFWPKLYLICISLCPSSRSPHWAPHLLAWLCPAATSRAAFADSVRRQSESSSARVFQSQLDQIALTLYSVVLSSVFYVLYFPFHLSYFKIRKIFFITHHSLT